MSVLMGANVRAKRGLFNLRVLLAATDSAELKEW